MVLLFDPYAVAAPLNPFDIPAFCRIFHPFLFITMAQPPGSVIMRVEPLPGGVARTVIQDRNVVQRFMARRICGAISTGALVQGAWPLATLVETMALFRFQSVVVYNLLDRGIRIGNNMTQIAAITENIAWHVAMYTNILPVALHAAQGYVVPTADEYEAALWAMYNFRLSRFGVKTPNTAQPDVQLSLRMVGWAAWITYAIFIENMFTVDVNNVAYTLREATFAQMNQAAFAAQIVNAWEMTSPLSAALIPAAGILITNEDIRVATRDILHGFVPPLLNPVAHLNNTFLTSGTNRGDLFRLCCKYVMMISNVCSDNAEPPAGAARNAWTAGKHFNILAAEVVVTESASLPAHSYYVHDTLDELAHIAVIDAHFPANGV